MIAAVPRREQFRLELAETDQERIARDDPYTSAIRKMLLDARELGASDIHIEPNGSGLAVRMRVNGLLCRYLKPIPADFRESLIRRIKQLARLSIAVTSEAQDGRMSFPEWNLSVRVSVVPSNRSEKACLRLLDQDKEYRLEEMGLDPQCVAHFRRSLRHHNGVIVISGPTGSGKTTTLYSLLCALDRERLNIVTLEDPIEYEIDGINQTQVSKSLTFDMGLRAFLRQDPNVILVGEVRDAETARLCFQAASTGHLVLSTLHANNAAGVPSRLVQLGVDPYYVGANLRLAAAQRLVRKLCPLCSVPYDGQLLLFPRPEGADFRRSSGRSCENCTDGFVSRIPIVEYLVGEEIRAGFGGESVAPARPTLRLTAMALAARGEMDTEEATGVE